jgi:hypothetical protein
MTKTKINPYVVKGLNGRERGTWLRWYRSIKEQGGTVGPRVFLKEESAYWDRHGWHGVAALTLSAMGRRYACTLAWGPNCEVVAFVKLQAPYSPNYVRWCKNLGHPKGPVLMDLLFNEEVLSWPSR